MKFTLKILAGFVYLFVGTVVMCVGATTVFADGPSSSAHYQLQETALGGTGLFNSQSSNFQAFGSGGIIGQGNSAGTDFMINAGHMTTNDPSLAFGVINSNVSFGAFSAGAAATSTSSFEVVNYTSYGYVVQTLGTAPTFNGHTISTMSSTGPSQAGTEQFGINLVANTSPVSLGANPDQGQFGYGVAAPNYSTPNNYRFVNGETIATAPKSSGKTIYTISYIVNVSTLTPAGEYRGSQTVICTGTY